MADLEALWGASGAGGLTVVIPLPDDVIQGLMKVKSDIEKHKNDFFKQSLKSGNVSVNEAFDFLVLAIDEFVPSYRVHNRKFLFKCLRLSNGIRAVDIGIPENQVLVNVAGIRMVLLDLEEAVFRADLFEPQQHFVLREMVAARKAALALIATEAITLHKTPAKSPAKATTPRGKKSPSKKSASPTKSKKHCMNGAQCRNILNGSCRYHHTPQEIAQAGAIIEECIGISVPKVGWIIGANGDNITRIRKASGADIWIEDEIVKAKSGDKGKMRMLHVLGSREAVEKGIELVMESAASCNDESTGMNNVEALIGVSPVKQKELLESVLLQKLKDASGADIVAGDNTFSLRVVGTKMAVEKGIELVMQWAVHTSGKAKAKPKTPSVIDTTNATPTTDTKVDVDTSSATGVALDSPSESNDGEDDWPALGLPKEKVAISPRVSTKPFLRPSLESSYDARNVSEPPADINDNAAWPALETTEPSVTATPQRVPDKPAIQPVKKVVKKSTTSESKSSAKKKANADICIHGAACRFIRNGRDECEFYHSPKELELAAAAAAKKKGKVATSTGMAEYVLRISRSQAAWIIGKKGNHVKEIIQKSGVTFSNDPADDGSKNDRIVRITGSQEAVDIAVGMVMERLPNREKANLGSDAPASSVSSESSDSKPTATLSIPNPAPVENGPSLDSQLASSLISASKTAFAAPPILVPLVSSPDLESQQQTPVANSSGSKPIATAPPPSPISLGKNTALDSKQQAMLISPPQPVRQFFPSQHDTSFASSNISVSSVAGTTMSDVTKNSQTQERDGAIIGGQTIPMSVPTMSSPRVMTPLSFQGQSVNHSFSNSSPASQKQLVGQVASIEPLAFVESTLQQQTTGQAANIEATAPSASNPADVLLSFLDEQKKCLKSSPGAFRRWLATEDITSLDDLAEAVSDDEYLRDVLQQGDGNDVGVKGFKRSAFKKAVLEASQATPSRPRPTCSEEGSDGKVSKDEPPELVCPISQVLMTNDPVIAADGHTYERSAIEAWYQRQNSEVIAAQQQMATVGSDSLRAREIIERGVLSPMTHARMEHLALTPNHAVRTMAKDSAASSK